jgi:hypothetical protein
MTNLIDLKWGAKTNTRMPIHCSQSNEPKDIEYASPESNVLVPELELELD